MALGLGIGTFGLRGTDAPITGSTATIPSLDLRFAQDQAFTVDPSSPGGCLISSIKGPDANFSRLSGATQVGADGLIEYAPENLFTKSQNFADAYWYKNDSTASAIIGADPFGSNGAFRLNAAATTGEHYAAVPNGMAVSGMKSVSIYAKKATSNFLWIFVGNTATAVAYFDLNSGVVGTVTGAFIDSATIEPVGDGWHRCVMTLSNNPPAWIGFGICNADNAADYAGSITDEIYIYGAQLERHSSARTYLPTTSAPVYGPRFDYDPVTLECKGLLIEEQRTNWQTQSNQFTVPVWGITSITVTPNAGLSPSGENDGWLFSGFGDSSSIYSISSHSGAPLTTPIAISFYLKAVSVLGKITVSSIYGTSFGLWEVDLSLVSSTEWQRITSTHSAVSVITPFTATNDASSIFLQKKIGSVAGDLSFYIYGAQFEVGTSASSYIPTTSAAVTRSADVCSISGADFASFYNQSEGTVACHTNTDEEAYPKMVFSLDNGTYAKRLQSLLYSADVQVYVADTTEQVNGDFNSGAFDPFNKHALAWGLNDFAGCENGASLFTDTSATIPIVDRLNFGVDAIGGYSLNGHIARLTYYPKRLSNSKLQTLTA